MLIDQCRAPHSMMPSVPAAVVAVLTSRYKYFFLWVLDQFYWAQRFYFLLTPDRYQNAIYALHLKRYNVINSSWRQKSRIADRILLLGSGDRIRPKTCFNPPRNGDTHKNWPRSAGFSAWRSIPWTTSVCALYSWMSDETFWFSNRLFIISFSTYKI